MDSKASSLDGCIQRLEGVAPGAPLLALGQTVLWDEPMKAGVALALRRLGSDRRFVAGVHDTDYFAKLPGDSLKDGGFRAVPHNATTTRGLWSAAGEFSALFGSETVISRQDFLSAGLNVVKVNRGMPGILDEATEAFGWRGVVALGGEPPVVAEMPLEGVLPVLRETFQWAVSETIDCVTGPDREKALARAKSLLEIFDRRSKAPGQTLSGFYRSLLPDLLTFVSGERVGAEVTASTELLRFNCETCDQPRFELVERFIHPETRTEAGEAYNLALAGSEIYGLERFGSGAIPFDLYVPGRGRGTLRIGNRALIIMTPAPLFISLKRPLRTVRDLAAAIEGKFGPDCALIGKAVTLIGMLGREFAFVFHEGASSYVRYTRRFHELLHERGVGLPLNPILRIKYSPWEALEGCCSWLRLPEPLVQAFGSEELCSPSFAGRVKAVQEEQKNLLNELAALRRPMDLIRFLDHEVGGSWKSLASEYDALHRRIGGVTERVREMKEERFALYAERRQLRQLRSDLERQKGEQFREAIFEKPTSENATAKRHELAERIDHTIHRISAIQEQLHASVRGQREVVADPQVLRVHERRREIELEAELKRMRLIRNAVIASKGLSRAGYRPSAWWFPLLCTSDHWFHRTVQDAECYLEPLSPASAKPESVESALGIDEAGS